VDFLGELLVPLAEGTALLARLDIWVLAVIGVAYGIFAGAMPGIGTTLAYGLVLPFTFPMEPVQAVAFLLAISVGSGFGNSIPAILLSVPGTPAAILTAIDGFKLHKRGESGLALAVSFFAAIVGQLISIPFFVVLVVPLSGLAYVFLAPELFGLYMFGLVAIVSLTGKNLLKGLTGAAIGLTIAFVGIDAMNGTPRFVPSAEFRNGFETAPAVIGLLAVSELFRQSRQAFQWDTVVEKFTAKWPAWKDLRATLRPILGGTVLGTLVGAIPGAGATPAAMISYQQAQAFSKHPEEFGNGSVEGIAANESAQNASNSGELIPTLGIAIPGSGSMVLLLASLQVHGLVPGPLLIRETPDLLYAAVAGMLAASVLLIFTGWWISKSMLWIVTIDRSMVIILALATTVLGVYSLSFRLFDVMTALVLGVVGYFMLRYGYSTAAAALAVILARGLERSLRQGLNLFDNNIFEFLSRPLTAIIVGASVVFLVIGIRRTLRFQRAAARERARVAAEAQAAGSPPSG
jgi:putative tricarboxylic transport membrane protein